MRYLHSISTTPIYGLSDRCRCYRSDSGVGEDEFGGLSPDIVRALGQNKARAMASYMRGDRGCETVVDDLRCDADSGSKLRYAGKLEKKRRNKNS